MEGGGASEPHLFCTGLALLPYAAPVFMTVKCMQAPAGVVIGVQLDPVTSSVLQYHLVVVLQLPDQELPIRDTVWAPPACVLPQ